MSGPAGHPKLAALEERIARVLRGPDAIESQRLFRLVRPVLALARWRTTLAVEATTSLLTTLREPGAAEEERERAFEAALDELGLNVEAIERVAIVRRSSPIAHAAWLRRVADVLAIAAEALASREPARADRSALLPPLTVSPDASSALSLGGAPAPAPADDDDGDVRIVDLELAAIDHLFAAARAETMLLGRRRRLLVAARQRLLDAAAALPLDRDGVRARAAYVAREITRIDRLEAAGLDADVSLVHQARQALARRDGGRLFTAVVALDANAAAANDRAIARRTGPALAAIRRGTANDDAASSIARSAAEVLGEIAPAVTAAVAGLRKDAERRLTLGGVPAEREAATSLLEYLPPEADRQLLRAALAADGLFEVGGALAPVRIDEAFTTLRLVKHPTQEMTLTPAEDVHDIRDAVIGDPRSVLLDLATGRLLARRFVRAEPARRSRVVMRGEVRVYVLDGSGSMTGARARVRDAILVAELSTMMRRLESPGTVRCTLLYRYFNENLGPVTRISSVAEARSAIRDVVATERDGGTAIEEALLASLAEIAAARASDPDLARAQIVLVTDGEAPVDEAKIVAEREAIAGLPIGVSVIALGQENDALRGLVARQRAAGEAAFYHFLDDGELAEIVGGALDRDDAIHPPSRWRDLDGLGREAELARVLEEEAGALLDDLEHLDRARDHEALERLEEEVRARRELGLSEDEDGASASDGAGARVEALRRDRVALAARFARWFPEPAGAAAAAAQRPPRGTRARDDLDATICALASVAEVIELLGGTEVTRQADAIELLERLLPDARLTPSRYRAVLREHPAAVAPALQAARDAVRGAP